MRNISSSDLFCGAGGFSTGLLDACSDLGRGVDLLAVNHWDKAIATHSLNHPDVRHLCENLDNVDPRKVHPGGKLDILLASPECTHHSNARGGKPMSDQSRASAWHIVRWAEALRIENIIVENVREFKTWGPLDSKGKPIKSKKGDVFRAWCNALESLGYHVDFQVLNAADYGGATARQRLFVQASRRRRPRWPTVTHSAGAELFTEHRHRGAREIIDWNLEGNSIFGRKKPLADKTLARIMAGLKKFGGMEFVIGQQSCAAPRELGQPLPTIATAGAISLVQPFLVVFRNNSDGASLEAPLGTITTTGKHHALCEPFIVKFNGDAHRKEEPIAVFEREGVTYGLMDIRFRMLQPHECAAAMGFGDYQFTGTKADKMKMIGNAVSVECARALCRTVLQ